MTGLSPYYLWGKQETRKEDEEVREVFDRELEKHLEETEKQPFRACPCCGQNVFDYDEAFKIGDEFFCWDCVMKVKTSDVNIEPTEYR